MKLHGHFKLYKGEQQMPERLRGNHKTIWVWEKAWNEATDRNDDMIKAWLEDYTDAGLIQFSSNDKTPTSLKALLFNQYAKGYWKMSNAAEDFKKWYNRKYKNL